MNFWFWVLVVAAVLNVAALVVEVRRYRKAKAIRREDAKMAARVTKQCDDEAICKAIEERWGSKSQAVIRAARHHGMPVRDLALSKEEFDAAIDESVKRIAMEFDKFMVKGGSK